MRNPITLNWAGSARKLEQYSFADVIEGTVSDQVFKNKIVLVGMTAAGIDADRTPFDLNPPASGVHLQATLVHNLLQRNALRPLNQWGWLWLILWGPILSGVLSYWRTETQGAIALTLALSWGGLALGLLKLSYLLPVAFPIGLIATTSIAVAISERLHMNAILQRQVRRLWQRYEPDLVLYPVTDAKPALSEMASMQRVSQLSALADQFGRSQSTQAAIARSLSIGLAAADFDGLVWFANPIVTALLQLEIGTRLESILVPFWLSAEDWQQALSMLLMEQPADSVERKVRDRWYCLRLEPLTYQALNPGSEFHLDGILLLIEDVSDRKKIEANLDRQIEELNQMSQVKDEFLSTVSHELRTPLTNIKMAVQLLKISKTEEQRDRYLGILEDECDREIELINELLDLQRLESGMMILNPEQVELQTWLLETVEPFYKRAEARQQQLRVEVSDEMSILICDRSSLERIVVELVNNACKYTPPGEAIVVMASSDRARVELKVSNSGAEIPTEELARVFERFYRVPRSDKWNQGGTGLGLALVQKLVECMQGKIQVESAENWTTFLVSLPLN